MKKIKLNKRDIVVLIILAFIVITAFIYVSYKQIEYYKFAKEMENLYTKNETPVFSIDKIVMYSSANAIDKSEGQTLQDLNVCQYTDMAIYIDNMVDINELVKESDAMGVSTENTDDEASRKIKEHTIKELYIDNIRLNEASNRGEKTLSYKSILSFAKFRNATPSDSENEEKNDDTENSNNEENKEKNDDTENSNNEENKENKDDQKNDEIETEDQEKQQERIDFEIISTNVDNERSDYTKPTFYADCSNPITLNYMNKNIVTGYAVSAQDTQIKFDGSILQSVGVNLADIACTINFDIHMKNNLNQEFICSVDIDIPLSNENKTIYNGYMYGMQNELQEKYKFFKK